MVGYIEHFNQFLQQKNLLEHYTIKPFINFYPLHNTLYLTDYDPQRVPEIIEQVKEIARTHHILHLESAKFIASPNGYVMLSLVNTTELTELSQTVAKGLKNLRDHQAQIPSWAAADPKRQKLFTEWGSPNVLEFYTPHFSIFDPMHLNSEQQKQFITQLRPLVEEINQQLKPITVDADVIGVGVANEQGQIIKELISFRLG